MYQIIDLNTGKVLGYEKAVSSKAALDQWKENNGYRINLKAEGMDALQIDNLNRSNRGELIGE